MRGRGCQKPSMKMSQQLCFHFQCFLLYSALSQFQEPRACPASVPNVPWPRGGHMLCAQCPAVDAGSLMRTACISAASCRDAAQPEPQSLVQLQPGSSAPPPGSHWPVPLVLDSKGEDQHKGKHGNIIPVWSLSCNSLLLLFVLRTAQLG